MAGLIIKSLSKIFEIENKGIQVLKNINLIIPNGSFTTIVGKSGCGKTTLLKLLCGLETKTKGKQLYLVSKASVLHINVSFSSEVKMKANL